MSWEEPIETEILKYCESMLTGYRETLNGNPNCQEVALWERLLGGNDSMRQQVLGNIMAYETVIKHIREEVDMRKKLKEVK